jgi:hypothetical protein
MKHSASLALSAIAVVGGLAACPLRSAAQLSPAPTPVAIPHPDFSSMMFLTGTWTCTQILRGKERPDTSTTTIGMDGAWMVTEETAPPFDQYRTYTIKATSYMTYDPTIKKWVQLGADSGGGYGIVSSPGWQGNTITWTGNALDGSRSTDVVTKVSDTETTDASTVTDSHGKVTKTTINCAKSSG